MMSLWDALRMNMMISYQELVRTFPNGVPLTVALRETTAGAGRTGAFQAKATFNFTYE